SETVMGKWLARRGRRDDLVIMTKVGSLEGRKGLSASNIAAAVEDSLRRLQTDYLDVYFAHIDDDTVPLEETIEAFSRLVDAGKVRTMGASNYNAGRLREALGISQDKGLSRYEVIQPGYNLYDRAGSGRWGFPRTRGGRAPGSSVRAATCLTGPARSRSSRAWCGRKALAWWPALPWPPGSSPASTTARRTWKGRRVQACWKGISTSAACACSMPCARLPATSMPPRRKWRWRG